MHNRDALEPAHHFPADSHVLMFWELWLTPIL
jgi:hypothetical protein